MIKFRSLQTRLMIAFAALSLLICIFFIRFSTLLIETAETNAYLSILNELKMQLTTNDSSSMSLSLQSVKWYSDLNLVPDEISRQVGYLSSGHFETTDAQQYVFMTFENKGMSQLLVMNTNNFQANHVLNSYKSLFLISISVSAFVLCMLSSWYLSKLLSKPIQSLTHDVKNKGRSIDTLFSKNAGNKPVYGIDREDEIGMLANALEASYNQIQTLLQREQNFTRDVSHELRTPITLIKNTLAIDHSANKDDDRLVLLKQAATELEQTVETLLALARQENLIFNELAVLPIIEKTVLNIYHIYPDIEFNAKIKVDPKFKATGNALLLSLLCQNLVNNGFYHGDGQAMRIYSQQNSLVFENTINSKQDRPYYQGLGHGQYLVKRIVEQMGWSINVEQHERLYKVVVYTI